LGGLLQGWLTLAALVMSVAVGVWLSRVTRRRSRRTVDEWATANGYSVVSAELRHFRRGPFSLDGNPPFQVYRAQLRWPDGVVRDAWVACDPVLGSVVDVLWT